MSSTGWCCFSGKPPDGPYPENGDWSPSQKQNEVIVVDVTAYHLREAVAQDAELIAGWLEDPRDCRLTIGHAPLRDGEFHEWLMAEDQGCWILDGPEGPLGYGEVWIDADARDLELAHLMIRPEHRNRGWGRLLTQLLFDRGRPYGFPTVFMRIYPENASALRCYESAGFAPVSAMTSDIGLEWVWLSKSYDSEHSV